MSQGPTPGDKWRLQVEAWWALIVRILAFFLGAVIVGYQALSNVSNGNSWLIEVVLILVGVGLMGPVIVPSVVQMLIAARGLLYPDPEPERKDSEK